MKVYAKASAANKKKDFRLYLIGVFEQRVRKNPKYSLRAFAESLDINHSTLSQFLREKRSLTPEMIQKLGEKLSLTTKQLKGYLPKEKKDEPETPVHDIVNDIFQFVADWHHHAVYEILGLKDFKNDFEWIAKRVGISVAEVQSSFERLKRLGLVAVDESGQWKQLHSIVRTDASRKFFSDPKSAIAADQYHIQLLEQAIHAIKNVPHALQGKGSLVATINTKRLPEIAERLKKFIFEMNEFVAEDPEKDAVYMIGVSLFPLTKKL